MASVSPPKPWERAGAAAGSKSLNESFITDVTDRSFRSCVVVFIQSCDLHPPSPVHIYNLGPDRDHRPDDHRRSLSP